MVNKLNSLPADKSESASMNADTIVGITNDSSSRTQIVRRGDIRVVCIKID